MQRIACTFWGCCTKERSIETWTFYWRRSGWLRTRLWTLPCRRRSGLGTVKAAPPADIPQRLPLPPVGYQHGHDGVADTEAQRGELLPESSRAEASKREGAAGGRATAYVEGVSTRRLDDPALSKGKVVVNDRGATASPRGRCPAPADRQAGVEFSRLHPA